MVGVSGGWRKGKCQSCAASATLRHTRRGERELEGGQREGRGYAVAAASRAGARRRSLFTTSWLIVTRAGCAAALFVCILLWRAQRYEVYNMRNILKSTSRGLILRDERERLMEFPTRQDYIDQMREHDLIRSEADFIADDRLTEAVYLDWLLRPQVGCVFAQLLARPVNRVGMRTVVARGASGFGDPIELAVQIAHLVNECVAEASTEALSVLMPQVLDPERLTHLVWQLGHQPEWTIEQERRWRGTLVLIGLRVQIADNVVAETLGMGPFSIFPTTRQSPVTTLEIRTKTERAKRGQLSKAHLASHLADLPVGHFMTSDQHRSRRVRFTPWLKKRILGEQGDLRAKAGITYSVPAAMWSSLKVSSP